eukprot:scaffold90352_cov75-Phaeocystis_antarctica.AAC.2
MIYHPPPHTPRHVELVIVATGENTPHYLAHVSTSSRTACSTASVLALFCSRFSLIAVRRVRRALAVPPSTPSGKFRGSSATFFTRLVACPAQGVRRFIRGQLHLQELGESGVTQHFHL